MQTRVFIAVFAAVIVVAAARVSATGECASMPCQNNGVCIEGSGDFACQCPSGFSGLYCQTNIDECASSPCRDGGTCADNVGYYDCTCTTNTFGSNCDVAPCTTAPCSNGGTCAATHNCSAMANPNTNAFVARDNAAVMTWKSFAIFVGGGLTASMYTKDVSMIDTRDGSWYALPSLTYPRTSACGAAVPGTGMLFVAGGLNATATLQTVEYYNIVTGASSWTYTSPMTGNLAGTPVCAVAEDNFYVSRRSIADSSVRVWQYNGATGAAGTSLLIGTFSSTPLMTAYGYKLYMGMNTGNLVVVDTRTMTFTTLVGVIPLQLSVTSRYRFWAMSGARLIMVREAFNNQANYLATEVWSYDTISGVGYSMNKTYASREPCMAASDTSVFVAGGQICTPLVTAGVTSLTSQYQASSGAWAPGPNLSTAVARCSMTYVADTRTYVVYGGIVNGDIRVRNVDMFLDSPPIQRSTTGACSPYRTCECPPGLTGTSCDEDINECEMDNGGCGATVACDNTFGGFECLPL